ncbi:MAG: RNA polymerase sigma factor [Gammaproteobacteria bacterium]|nr:RNA polymerase sigma factor [Gammaproteobacteria bacterium]MDH4316697.1 RNA polymerase sigma factor [Gammaproteobacteria bacterium]MDH5215487.1 RNA polymerase sigma factor [Gammaproteobacteria bacterium]
MLLHAQDKKLVKQMLAGDEQAFRRFFDDNFRRLYRFALARLGNDMDAAEEVAQMALCKATQNLDSYRGEAALFTWLCTICRNAATDWLRQQGRYRENIVLIEDFPQVQAVVDSLEEDDSLRPDRRQERVELVRLIQVALDKLPPNYGNVLEWKYIDGYSVKEIAGRMELGTEATQSLLARAKRAFCDVYATMSESLQVENANRGLT